jgi:type IV secretory pathway protease TraF
MMFKFILMTLLLMASQGPQPAPPPSNPADNGTVEGLVVWASRSQPLEGIPVYLLRDGEQAQAAMRRGVATSDAAGRFILRDVPPGEYSIAANRRGYFPETEPNLVRVSVAPRQQVRDVRLRMIVGGSISGRILDVNGHGLAEVQLTTSSATVPQNVAPPGFFVSGVSGSFANTDDRGEYRIWGLRPGSYVLQADVNMWASDSTTFYPGVRDRSSALAVTVKEAEDASAIFSVEPRLKPVFAISGVIVGSAPGVPAGVVERIWIWSKNNGSTYYDNRAADRTNGRFEIRNIFPDTYELFPDARDANGKMYTSRTPVEVVDRSIDSLTLPANPGIDLRGRITVNGEIPANRYGTPTVRPVTVRGINVQEISEMAGQPPPPIQMDAESGVFMIPNLAPGIYRLDAAGMPPTAYVEDVRVRAASVLNEGFTVGDAPIQGLEIALGFPGGAVQGVVRNARQEPALRATVVLVPEPSQRQIGSRYRSAMTDRDGKFTLGGIPPGNYKAFAWEAPQWMQSPATGTRVISEDFLRRHETRGQAVTIEKAGNLTLALSLIPRDTQ